MNSMSHIGLSGIHASPHATFASHCAGVHSSSCGDEFPRYGNCPSLIG